jgi:hypothetical protein
MVERAAPGDGIERGRGPTRRRILWQELVGILRRVATAARLRRAVKPPRYTRRNDRDLARAPPRSALTMADLRDHQR